MNLISAFLMIFLTSCSGSIVFLLWGILRLWLQKKGKLRGIRLCLILTVFFYLIPVMFLWLAWQTRLFSDGIMGNLFQRTPELQQIFLAAALIWLIGFAWACIRGYEGRRRLKDMIRQTIPADEQIQSLAREIESSQKLRNIPVYLTEFPVVPFISGIRRCRIVIPRKDYREQELQMILEHELWHYRQGDLFIKKICGFIERIQWFNPLVRYLSREIDKWGDVCCDIRLCFGDSPRSRKEYFYVVCGNLPGDSLEIPSGMRLRGGLKEVKERAVKMSKYDPKKEMKKWGTVLMAICFFMVSAVTTMAAGNGVREVYGQVYEATEEVILEQKEDTEVSEEYEWVLEGSGYEIIDSGEDLSKETRGFKTYNWEIPANNIIRTSSIYLSKGEEVSVSIISNPMTAKTGIGLDQPNGVLRGVSGTGSYSHTFIVNQTGFHKIYARNETGSAIEVVVTVLFE